MSAYPRQISASLSFRLTQTYKHIGREGEAHENQSPTQIVRKIDHGTSLKVSSINTRLCSVASRIAHALSIHILQHYRWGKHMYAMKYTTNRRIRYSKSKRVCKSGKDANYQLILTHHSSITTQSTGS